MFTALLLTMAEKVGVPTAQLMADTHTVVWLYGGISFSNTTERTTDTLTNTCHSENRYAQNL